MVALVCALVARLAKQTQVMIMKSEIIMNNLTLYEIAAEYRDMVEQLMATQDDSQTIADTLEGESYPLTIKAQNVAYAIKNLEATASAIKSAEKEMANRRKRIENHAQHLRDYAMTCMQVAGVQNIDCPHFAITIKKNPPMVEIFEPALLPAKYWQIPEPPPAAPVKQRIHDALKAGIDVPGAKLAQGLRLDIK